MCASDTCTCKEFSQVHVLTLLCNKILRNASRNHFIPFDRTNFTNACTLATSLELVRNK